MGVVRGLIQDVANEELTVGLGSILGFYRVFLQEHFFYDFVHTNLYAIV
jgi:hypothetical protein